MTATLFNLYFRLNRPLVRVGAWSAVVLVLLIPFAYYVVFFNFYRAFALIYYGIESSVIIGFLLAAVIGANAFAREQNEGSADFIGMMPVSGFRRVTVKLLASLACVLLPFVLIACMLLLQLAFFSCSPFTVYLEYNAREVFRLIEESTFAAPVIIGATGAVFGIAWGASAFLKSPGLSLTIALASVIGAYAVMAERAAIHRADARWTSADVRYYFFILSLAALLVGVVGVTVGCVHQMRRHGATGAMPMWMLIRKDFRVFRVPLLSTLIIATMLYSIGPLITLLMEWDFPEQERMKSCLLSLTNASLLGLTFSPVFAGAIGGMAFASERRDRHLDFVGMLPLSRRRTTVVKLLIATILSTAVYIVAALIFVAIHLWTFSAFNIRFGYLISSDPNPMYYPNWSGLIFVIVAAFTIAVFGLAWMASSMLRSPALAMGIGVALVLFVYFWMVIIPDRYPGDFEMAAMAFIKGATGVGLIAVLAGSVMQCRRESP